MAATVSQGTGRPSLSASLSSGCAALQCLSAHAQTDCEGDTAELEHAGNMNRHTFMHSHEQVPQSEQQVSFDSDGNESLDILKRTRCSMCQESNR